MSGPRRVPTVADLYALRRLSIALEDQALELAGQLLAQGTPAVRVAQGLNVSRAQLYRLINAGRIARTDEAPGA